MKATLEFQLPEEAWEHQVALQGMDWWLAYLDIEKQVRDWVKYGHEFKSANEALEAVMDLVLQIRDDRNLVGED